MTGYISEAISRFAGCTAGSGGTFLGLPTWYKYLPTSDNIAGKCTPRLDLLNNPNSIAAIVLAIVELLLRLGGMVALGFVIYGGFRYLTSQGEPENTNSARQTIINALIGLFIVILATGIVRFVGVNLK